MKTFVSLAAAAFAVTSLLGAARPAQAADLVETAMSAPEFSTLVKAVKAAGLVDTLKGEGPYTVFAPTNAAFAKVPKAKLNALLANKAQLRAVLLYHVVPGKVEAADVLAMKNPSMAKTAQGTSLRVKTTVPVMVNNARVIKTDIQADNGVIHVIDSVLMPKPGARRMNKMSAGSAHR
jgi:uncharacterized surface protein with fasciclin (FAS1) repeats